MSNNKLTRQQKEAVGLLSIGTFLEYFDLMLYVHMAVLLNDLFFPKTDPFSSQLITAFGFCSTYLLRPFGALLFGWLGDNFGRKLVVIITTFLMSISCVTIASLPTYATIGITASIAITICRIMQGVSASSESHGAEIFLTEISKPPTQYPLVAMVTVFQALGTSFAIFICSVFTQYHFNWRIVFFIGAGVAIIGTIARTTLKETNDFSNKKKSLLKKLEKASIDTNRINKEAINSEKVPILISVSYFLIKCARPPCFYFIYIYCSDVLKLKLGLSPEQIIQHNFWVSVVDFIGILGLVFLSYRIYPLKILKAKFFLFFICLVFFPIIMSYTNEAKYIFIIQCLSALFVFDHVPASPIFYKYFAVLKRFTYTGVISALGKFFTYLTTSFGLVYATKVLGYYGILVVIIPVGIGYYIALSYFSYLENKEEKKVY